MLGTLAFFVTGVAILIYALLGKRTRTMNANIKNLERDLTFFLIYYGVAVGTTFFHERIALKTVIAAGPARFLSDISALDNQERLRLCRKRR